MSRMAKSRRLAATSLMKLAATPKIPALADRAERLRLLLRGEDRAAHEALKIGAFGDKSVESLQSGGDFAGRVSVLG
jgi:hypothetical protein